jgi:hypothetical protein
MQFKATDAQILEVFRLAINASMAMGLGMIHYQAKDWDTEKVTTIFEPHLNRPSITLDYVEGRMVKLSVRRMPEGEWLITDKAPNVEYESWCTKYPTYPALLRAAGIEVLI